MYLVAAEGSCVYIMKYTNLGKTVTGDRYPKQHVIKLNQALKEKRPEQPGTEDT